MQRIKKSRETPLYFLSTQPEIIYPWRVGYTLIIWAAIARSRCGCIRFGKLHDPKAGVGFFLLCIEDQVRFFESGRVILSSC